MSNQACFRMCSGAGIAVLAFLNAYSQNLSQEFQSTAQCVSAYKNSYLKTFNLTLDQWKAKCDVGKTSQQILQELNPKNESDAGHFAHAAKLKEISTALEAIEIKTGKIVASGDVAPLFGEKAASDPAVSANAPQEPSVKPSSTKSITYILLGGQPSISHPRGSILSSPPVIPACNAESKSLNMPSSISSAYLALEHRIACLPDGWHTKHALLHFLQLTGPRNYYGADSLGVANHGLNTFFENKSAEDRQFYTLVKDFYSRVAKKSPSFEYSPRLSDEAGQGKYKDTEPGWIWQEAMSVAGNDPRLAMQLVGFCGHDNIMQAGLTTRLTDKESQRALEEEKSDLLREISEIKKTLRSYPQFAHVDLERMMQTPASENELSIDLDEISMSLHPPSDSPKARHTKPPPELLLAKLRAKNGKLARLDVDDFKIQTEGICSNAISLYVPKSLDRQADIPASLKDKIAKTQAPTKGAQGLPAKYYHVYGAAFVACELISEGATPILAKHLESESAWAYRTIRMTADSKHYADLRAQIADLRKQYISKLPSGQKQLSEEEFIHQLTQDKTLADHLSPSDPATLKIDMLHFSLSKMDAFELMDRWGYGGKIWGIQLPTIDTRLGWLKGSFLKSKPDGWSEERFAAAKQRLETFLVDWKWTEAQHAAGAEFAAKVCKQKK